MARELASSWDEVTASVGGADPLLLVTALLVGVISMTSIGMAWGRCISVVGARLPRRAVLRSYFVGQLGKYVPGGIWPVVGRAEMARREGVGGSAAYGSTVLSMSLTYLAAALVSTSAWLLFARDDRNQTWWPIAGLVLAGVTALHPAIVTRVLSLLRRVSRRHLDLVVPSWGTSVGLLMRHVPAWLGISTATWLVARALDSTPPDLSNLVFATSLSWLLGFLAFGVPGGIGVREAIFIATVQLTSSGVAVAVALVARVLFVVVDVAGAGVSSLAVGIARRWSDHPGRARP